MEGKKEHLLLVLSWWTTTSPRSRNEVALVLGTGSEKEVPVLGAGSNNASRSCCTDMILCGTLTENVDMGGIKDCEQSIPVGNRYGPTTPDLFAAKNKLCEEMFQICWTRVSAPLTRTSPVLDDCYCIVVSRCNKLAHTSRYSTEISQLDIHSSCSRLDVPRILLIPATLLPTTHSHEQTFPSPDRDRRTEADHRRHPPCG